MNFMVTYFEIPVRYTIMGRFPGHTLTCPAEKLPERFDRYFAASAVVSNAYVSRALVRTFVSYLLT
jgi:hypothetical protein